MKIMKGEAVNWGVLLSTVTLVVYVSFVLGSYASAQQLSSADIVGRWRSLETTKGGIGQLWEFRSDGTVNAGVGAVVEMPWRIENDQLIFPPAAVGDREQKYTLKWLGDNKLRWEAEGGVAELVRVGDRSDPANPIIGEWMETREMDGRNVECRYLFSARGEVLLLIPMAIQHGSYTISGSVLRVKRQGLMSEFKFKIAENLLTLVAIKGGQESHFARY